jgi:dATP/dGTP diphosphohydrolase
MIIVSEPAVIDSAHIDNQRKWSYRTFGPGPHLEGIIDHIQKELVEIEQAPEDLEEWVDVIILGIDGAWRAGYGPQEIIDAIVAKQKKNEQRKWPDWRNVPPGKAIEHIR